MKRNRMCDEFAHLWPPTSAPEDYVEEAQYWHDTLREKLGPGRHEILDLGDCGGHLREDVSQLHQAQSRC